MRLQNASRVLEVSGSRNLARIPSVAAHTGVSIVVPRQDRSPEGAVQLADEALYSAKRSGRNSIAVVDIEYALFNTGSFRRSA